MKLLTFELEELFELLLFELLLLDPLLLLLDPLLLLLEPLLLLLDPLLLLEALLLLLSSSPVPRRLNLRWTASMSPNISSRPSVSAAKMRRPPPSAWTEQAARRRPKIAMASFLVPTSMVDSLCLDEGS